MLDVARECIEASADNSVMIFYGRGEHTSLLGITFKRIGNDASVINHYLWSRTLDREGLMSRRATAQLVESLRIFKPDIVHIHNLHGHYLHYPTLFGFLEKLDIPVVMTLHDLWPLTGSCCFPDKCNKWEQSCRHCPDRSLYPATLLSNSRINKLLKTDCINRLPNVTLVTPSKWAARRVARSSLRLCPTITIPNGVNDDVFKTISTNEPGESDATTILAVANKWEARKRPDILCDIAHLLNDSERLVIVGDFGKKPPLLPHTKFLHNIMDYETLVEVYNNADYTISASINETYGMTIAESMACGTPVIVPEHSAMAEYVTKSDGVIIPSVNPSEYIDAIRQPQATFTPHAPLSRKEAAGRYMDLFTSLINEIH